MALEDAKNPLKGVSGPGKYAKRTDRIPANSYGDQTQLAEIASGAPIAKTPDVRPTPASELAATQPQTPITPLYAQSQRPEEPVTHGAPIGAGAGPEALAMRKPDDTNFRAQIQASKPVLAYIIDLPTTSPETRDAIKQLWDMQ
jgi:hypothetical protein